MDNPIDYLQKKIDDMVYTYDLIVNSSYGSGNKESAKPRAKFEADKKLDLDKINDSINEYKSAVSALIELEIIK